MRRVVITAMAVLLLLAATAACSSDEPQEDGSSAEAPSPILAEYDVTGDGWSMAMTPEHLWVQVDPPVDSVVRVDKATGEVEPMVATGRFAASGPEGLWVVSGDWLVKIDPTSGDELVRVPSGGALDVAEGSVWLRTESGELLRVDPDSGKTRVVAKTNPASCLEPKRLEIAFGSAWQACKEGAVVSMALDGSQTRVIPTEAGAHTFTVTDDAVWVTNYEAGSVTRIDPETGATTTIQGTGEGVGITSGGGFVWAADFMGISQIDPDTNKIVGHLDVGPGEYYELVWDDGVIWASTRTTRLLKVQAL